MNLKIKFADKYLRQSFIAWAVERGLEYLDAESANKRIIELTVENMALRAGLDAAAMREGAKP